jgi:S-(hydroxymethyl)glutathione dehydrogenase/alcohol dehydrogenase
VGAKSAGAATIIGIDIVGHKLEQAKALGATDVLNAANGDPVAGILRITGGRGVDCAFESAGRPETMETAFRSVRENGGLCILAGNLAAGQKISIDPFDLIKGRRIIGTWGGETKPDLDIPRYAQSYLDGKLNLTPLITHEYAFAEINQAFDDLEQGRVGRALLKMSGGTD